MTLIEVLVTIFIMGIGMLAILTLFPLSAMNMARAVKNDRSGQQARATEGFFRSWWKAEIVEKLGAGDPVLFGALDSPGAGLPPAGLLEPSYPVVVDPVGFLARNPPPTTLPGTSPDFIGDVPTRVPRRTMAMFGNNPQYILSAWYMKDTVGVDPNLRLTADREYRFNAAVVIRRPLNRNRYAVDVTVVAFDNRPFGFATAGSEAVFAARFTPGTTSILVTHAANAAIVRPGGWVMDASVNPGGTRPLIRHADFYQVVSVTPVSATQTVLEVQTAVRTTESTSTTSPAYDGTLVVFDGVSGVYTGSPLGG